MIIVIICSLELKYVLFSKWLSVLALCAALFIAATHASQLQDEEGMMDRAAEEKLLRILLGNKVDAEND